MVVKHSYWYTQQNCTLNFTPKITLLDGAFLSSILLNYDAKFFQNSNTTENWCK